MPRVRKAAAGLCSPRDTAPVTAPAPASCVVGPRWRALPRAGPPAVVAGRFTARIVGQLAAVAIAAHPRVVSPLWRHATAARAPPLPRWEEGQGILRLEVFDKKCTLALDRLDSLSDDTHVGHGTRKQSEDLLHTLLDCLSVCDTVTTRRALPLDRTSSASGLYESRWNQVTHQQSTC